MNFIRYILLVLVFFPSVTFGIISAEIFPWAALFAIFSLQYLNLKDALLTSVLIALFVISTTWVMLTNPQADAIRSLAAYLNPILIFLTFINLSDLWAERAIRLGKFLLIFFTLLGTAQYFGLLYPLEGIMNVFVPRASGGALTASGGRGVTLLSSEPSRAGVEFVYLYLLYRLTSYPNRSFILADVGLLLFLAIVVKGAQPFAFCLVALGILFVRRWYHVVILMMVALAAPLLELGSSNSRLVVLIAGLRDLDFSDAIFFLANESGHRLLTIYAFFLFGFYTLFGGGVGNWQASSIEAIKMTGVDVSTLRYFIVHGDGNIIGVRGSGLVSNLMLDLGILTTGFFFFWVWRLSARYRKLDNVTISIMLILFFKISFIGSIGEPLPWVVTALVLRYNHGRQGMPDTVESSGSKLNLSQKN